MLVRSFLSCEVFLSLHFFSHYEEDRRIDCFRLSMFRAFVIKQETQRSILSPVLSLPLIVSHKRFDTPP